MVSDRNNNVDKMSPKTEETKIRHLDYAAGKETKRPKVERLRCEYLLPHKGNRQCNMTRKVTERFCCQHIQTAKASSDGDVAEIKDKYARVPCPLDPNHSVRASALSKHLKKCSALKPNQITEEWFREDINVTRPDLKSLDDETVGVITKEEYLKWIQYVDEIYDRYLNHGHIKYGERPISQLIHDGLYRRLNELSNKKHAIQQGSLISQLEKISGLESDRIFIEFGAGRGELSRYIHQSLLFKYKRDPPVCPAFVLIDRSGVRMKLDSKIIKDAQEEGSSKESPYVERLKCDIKDLDCSKLEILRDNNYTGFIAVSKHLCGAATDLTLKCLVNYRSLYERSNSNQLKPLKGIEIALCCRHRCSYSTYPTNYLDNIDHRGFKILCKMSSWNVCGRRLSAKKVGAGDDCDGNEAGDEESHDSELEADAVGGHPSGLPIEKREEIGLKVQKILDYGRIRFLEDHGFDVNMIQYVEREISSENVCLVAVPL
ncbi:methyltransferase TRM13-domain-containing protein [Dipodascopsis uninucleata]